MHSSGDFVSEDANPLQMSRVDSTRVYGAGDTTDGSLGCLFFFFSGLVNQLGERVYDHLVGFVLPI